MASTKIVSYPPFMIPRLSIGTGASLCLVALLHLWACSPEESGQFAPNDVRAADSEVGEDADLRIDCGNLVTIDQLNAYVGSIRSIDNKAEPRAHSNQKELFADSITLIEKGKATHMTRAELDHYAGRLPSSDDWQIIASALASGRLASGGWRGCFLSNGKAAFVADAAGDLGLSSFDFDRQWRIE